MLRSRIAGQVFRFLLVGGSNTLITYAIFIGLGMIIPPWLAYSVAFAVGLIWVAFGSSRFVFRAQVGAARIVLFCAWYLVVFGAGQLVIRLISPQDFAALALTSLCVIAVTTPLTFFGGKLLFSRKAASQPTAKSDSL